MIEQRSVEHRAPYLAAAVKIANSLCSSALWWQQRCNWLSDDIDENANGWEVLTRNCSGDLYIGTAGIGIFLAQAYRATGDRVFAHTARGALMHALHDATHGSLAESDCVYGGTLGVAFAALETGRDLDDGYLMEAGISLAQAGAARGLSRIDGDDVMHGLAGVAAFAANLSRRHGDDRLLQWAREAGDALIAKGKRDARGLSWPGERNLPAFCGLSHGAAGEAWALGELAHATGDARYLAAARDAIAYEQSWYEPSVENWPDLFPDDLVDGRSESFAFSWCHGAPGISVARARLWQLHGDPAWREQAEAGARATMKSLRDALTTQTGNFSLCHGIAGNAELLADTLHRLGDDSGEALARFIADVGLARHGSGTVPWTGGVAGDDEPMSPSLMLGSAGTGHFYLRRHDRVHTANLVLPLTDTIDAASASMQTGVDEQASCA